MTTTTFQGEGLIRQFQQPKSVRSFCAICGTPLTYGRAPQRDPSGEAPHVDGRLEMRQHPSGELGSEGPQMNDPASTQYAVLSERRLHFGRMYWQNIGLHCLLLLGTAAIFHTASAPVLGAVCAAAGFATSLMAYIARRLRGLEVAYEQLLRNIEDGWIEAGAPHVQRAPISGTAGARQLVNFALAAAGVFLIAAGALVMATSLR